MIKYIYLTLFAVLITSCSTPEARKPITYSSGSFIKESAVRNKALYEKEQVAIEQIIAEKTEGNFKTSQYGFWYSYETKIEGDSIKPRFGDTVNFDYNIKDLSENTIYTKSALGNQNYIMDKEELFSGLREGLKLMKAGETVTFIFPSQKAYGYYGDEDRIGTNVPLICQVTINSITPNSTN